MTDELTRTGNITWASKEAEPSRLASNRVQAVARGGIRFTRGFMLKAKRRVKVITRGKSKYVQEIWLQ